MVPMIRHRLSPTRRVLPVLVAALASSLMLAGCGGSSEDKDKPEAKPASQPTQGGTVLAAVWPLTGLPAPDGTPDHPVMVVKIDNTTSSQPQIGLNKADLVTEELVEGGITRLAVFYYSKLPGVTGPVRSMRASDIGVVKPTKGVLVASGAAGPTIGRLKKAKVRYYTNDSGSSGFYRENGRRAPYNLMLNVPKFVTSLKKPAIVPASYLPWGDEKDFTGTQPAKTVNARFSRSHTTTWKFRKGTYFNTNSNAKAGKHFRPDSVLVLRVREGDAGYLDPAGNSVPETIFKGTGDLMLFHNGQVVRGTWHKDTLTSQLKLSTKAGPLKVPAGRTWLELVPRKADGGGVTFGP